MFQNLIAVHLTMKFLAFMNPNIHYRVRKRLSLDRILNHFNLVHTLKDKGKVVPRTGRVEV
jgi:hypothetical protein